MIKDAIVRFDTTLTTFVTSWPTWLHAPMLVVTTLGQPAVMCVAAGAVMLFAWQNAKPQIVYGLGIGVAAMLVNSLLKHFIHRTRPDTLYVSEMYFKTSSFPSGHAFGSTVICGMLAYLSLKYLPEPWGAVAAAGLGAFILLVGVSRIYLGAHYPTDVIAGWILGGIVAGLIIAIGRL
ncbi:MAG TPA: phosphatase PAP2 family protein [Candidatus Saccharimonadales bacterium]|nr:phosphatase PAP2 family protein [Candidatus Saccharimonadales bacterium]